MVEAMDQAVGKVVDTVDRLELTDRTIFVFMSDNGGLSTSEGWPTSNLPLRAGKGWLYEGGIREPMGIVAPGVTTAGTVCETPVTSTDFYPTLLDLCGLSLRPRQHLDGVSLKPLLAGGKLPERPLYWHYPHYGNQGGRPGSAVRLGDWKLIEWSLEPAVELYHLAEDIGEHHNLAAARPDKVAELRSMLETWRQASGALMPTRNPAWDPAAKPWS
jgi:arylsulfatase A-like enzyme